MTIRILSFLFAAVFPLKHFKMSNKIADFAQKAVSTTLITFTAIGSLNLLSMAHFKYRKAEKAELLLKEEMEKMGEFSEDGVVERSKEFNT